MKRILILLSLIILCVNNSFSQDSTSEPQNVVVDWKVGTSKTISQIDSVIIYNNDSVFLATGISSNYTIKILSKTDTVYEVLFKQIFFDNISLASDMVNASPIEQMMQELISKLQKTMTGLEYSFLVDQNTALAFEVKNQAHLRQLVEEMVAVFLNQLLERSNVELDESQKNELNLKIAQYLDSQMPAAIQTMLNTFNYIFQAYSFPFILDTTYTQEIEVSSVNQVQHGNQENKAKLIVNSSASDSELTIDYQYIYDKEEAYQTFVVDQGKADQIPIDEFDVDERVESTFDIDSSWIKSSLSFVNARMGNVVVNKATRVTIK